MTEQDPARRSGCQPTPCPRRAAPVPDLGFFAGTPQPRRRRRLRRRAPAPLAVRRRPPSPVRRRRRQPVRRLRQSRPPVRRTRAASPARSGPPTRRPRPAPGPPSKLGRRRRRGRRPARRGLRRPLRLAAVRRRPGAHRRRCAACHGSPTPSADRLIAGPAGRVRRRARRREHGARSALYTDGRAPATCSSPCAADQRRPGPARATTRSPAGRESQHGDVTCYSPAGSDRGRRRRHHVHAELLAPRGVRDGDGAHSRRTRRRSHRPPTRRGTRSDPPGRVVEGVRPEAGLGGLLAALALGRSRAARASG